MSFSDNTGLVNDNEVKLGQNKSLSGNECLRNPTWREWSLQRAGFAGKEFEGSPSFSFGCSVSMKFGFDRFLLMPLQLTTAEIIFI